MASASHLLDVVTQLRSMEAALASILMEAAVKTAALTDAGVFVLLETREGRRFAGNERLCREYRGDGLRPLGSGGADVEMEVDVSVSAVRQRPLVAVGKTKDDSKLVAASNTTSGATTDPAPHQLRRSAPFFDHFRSASFPRGDFLGGAIVSVPPTSRKRAPRGAGDAPKRKRARAKRASSSSASAESLLISAATASAPSASTVAEAASVNAAISAPVEPAPKTETVLKEEAKDAVKTPAKRRNGAGARRPRQRKARPSVSTSGFLVQNRLSIEPINNSESPSGFEIQPINAHDWNFETVGAARPDAGMDTENIVPEFKVEAFLEDATSGTTKICYDGDELRKVKDDEIDEEMTRHFEKIDNLLLDFMQSDEKVNDLRQITDAISFATPESAVKRLLNSHLYDVSRLLSRQYNLPRKDPITKRWFSDVFEKWWRGFPNLERFETEGLKIPDRKKFPSIKSYTRSRVHTWFGACLDRRHDIVPVNRGATKQGVDRAAFVENVVNGGGDTNNAPVGGEQSVVASVEQSVVASVKHSVVGSGEHNAIIREEHRALLSGQHNSVSRENESLPIGQESVAITETTTAESTRLEVEHQIVEGDAGGFKGGVVVGAYDTGCIEDIANVHDVCVGGQLEADVFESGADRVDNVSPATAASNALNELMNSCFP